MLEVNDLRAGYGRIPILDGVTFRVDAGDAVGVLGHNGMGKTTLMKTLMGLLPATGGTVAFDGADITREPTHVRARRGLGYVPQGRDIFPQLSVLDNLRMGARRPGVVERVLEDFPILRALLARPGGALSGGQQQILAIARCMCAEPRLILLDEPTEGVQPSIVEAIAEMLSRLRDARGVTLVVVEQHLEFVAALSSRVLVIQKGAILKELAAADLAEATVIDEIVGLGGPAPR
ncbi:MAG TPA: ATP-binding cassette domain-containing protein [Alphaproteobacteria bacterium]|jgi:urea ABC transporter ATP-binding protein UrtE